MTATVIDGRKLADALLTRIAREMADARDAGITPGLATVRIGDDYASAVYERRLGRVAEAVGLRFVTEWLPADVDAADALATVGKLNADPRISGILILRPLPAHVPEVGMYRILDPAKDIEAVHPVNAGLLAQGTPHFVPSTPAACFYLLDWYCQSVGGEPSTFYDGKTVVIVGRSNNVGKLALWLGLGRQRDGRVLRQAHLRCRDAGPLHPAGGHPDRGRRRARPRDGGHGEGRRRRHRRRDQCRSPTPPPARPVSWATSTPTRWPTRAEAVTPVPGGVGPITDVWLVHNAVRAATALHPDLPTLPGSHREEQEVMLWMPRFVNGLRSRSSGRAAGWNRRRGTRPSMRRPAGFRRAVETGGPDAVGMFSCSKATNEVNFVAQKFMRVAIGTNNIDSCNRT